MLDVPPRPAPARAVTARTGDVALVLRVLVPAAIVVQVCYPIVSGSVRDAVTVASVLLFASAATVHAAWTAGVRAAALLLAGSAGVGFAAELLGVHTGVPFGRYAYADALGPMLWGVPVVVAAAWAMLAWPAAVAARRLARGTAARVLITAWTLVAWDLFLDPQMTAAGYWRWADPSPHLPGVSTVPLTNLAGWAVVALVVAVAVQAAAGRDEIAHDRWPAALLLWTWVGSVVAGVVFLDLAAAAAWAGLALGAVAVPLLRSYRRPGRAA